MITNGYVTMYECMYPEALVSYDHHVWKYREHVLCT